MSTISIIRIDGLIPDQELLVERAEEIFGEHIEDWHGRLSEFEDAGPQSWTWDSKWELGIEAAAEALSKRYPLNEIQWEQEWDARDADEPGAVGGSYLGGVEFGRTEQRMVTVHLPIEGSPEWDALPAPERAVLRARRTLAAYERGVDRATQITDLLTDLIHLSYAEGFVLDELLIDAGNRHHDELTNPRD